jgi:hypothetical protein
LIDVGKRIVWVKTIYQGPMSNNEKNVLWTFKQEVAVNEMIQLFNTELLPVTE